MSRGSKSRDRLLRLGEAARLLGIHPLTLRIWADQGKLPVSRVNGQRRFEEKDVVALIERPDPAPPDDRVAAYVRVSGTTGQESSYASQEQELKEHYGARLVAVYKDRASGLREHRVGLDRLLQHAADGRFGVVAVTHKDRLARFGVTWIEELLAKDGVRVEVLHHKQVAEGMAELLEDFMSLVSTFAGRIYGIRSKEARKRLLDKAQGSGQPEVEAVPETGPGQ